MYPETGVRKSAAVVVIVLAILLSLSGAVHAQTSTSCDCCRDAEGSARCDVWDDLLANRDACNEEVAGTFDTCMRRCYPADSVQGRCGWIRDCLDTCRGNEARQNAGCSSRYRSQVRNKCPGALQAAKRSVDRCRRGRQEPCECSTTTAASGAVPAVTTAAGPGGVPAGVSGDPVAADPTTVGPTAGCQSSCVAHTVRACYRNCARGCGVDFMARGICQRFCRNANCRFLSLTCTDNEQPESGEYRACCVQSDTCTSDDPCVTTSTTTSTTSTTSTSSTTSSTSILSTTTSSTQVGVTTTTVTSTTIPI